MPDMPGLERVLPQPGELAAFTSPDGEHWYFSISTLTEEGGHTVIVEYTRAEARDFLQAMLTRFGDMP